VQGFVFSPYMPKIYTPTFECFAFLILRSPTGETVGRILTLNRLRIRHMTRFCARKWFGGLENLNSIG